MRQPATVIATIAWQRIVGTSGIIAARSGKRGSLRFVRRRADVRPVVLPFDPVDQ
jgi:hypothetical protein